MYSRADFSAGSGSSHWFAFGAGGSSVKSAFAAKIRQTQLLTAAPQEPTYLYHMFYMILYASKPFSSSVVFGTMRFVLVLFHQNRSIDKAFVESL